MKVATVSGGAQKLKSNSSSQDHELSSRRMPLLQSLKDNSNSNSNNSSNFVNTNRLSNPKGTKTRDVSSRYLSSSTTSCNSNAFSGSTLSSSSRRFPSPIVSRNSTPVSNGASMGSKRSVSADRRRPVVSRALRTDLDVKQSGPGELSAAAKMLVTSTRSVSVSFQGEYFPLPISKAKVVPPSPSQNSLKKGMTERSSSPLRGKVYGRGDQVENSKSSDQHRWPARARQGDLLSRSLDGRGGEKSTVIGSGNMIRALQQSSMDERSSFDVRLSLDLGSTESLMPNEQGSNRILVNNKSSVASDLTASDTDSISSGSSSGVQGSGGSARIRNESRGIASSARFWQETNSRLRRLQDPGSHGLTSPSSKFSAPSKLRKYPNDNALALPRTMSSSPIRGGVRPASPRPASPSKLVTPRASSPSRGLCSPSRVRNAVSTVNNNFIDSPSVMSYSVDVRRGKVGESRVFDAHLLRLMYNRHLQWRFVNARTEYSLLVQRHIVEKNLWGAWIMISNLRDTVSKKRHRLQLLRRKLKLAFILKGHMTCMEEWASLDKEHCISLLGATEALKASTLRLPVVGGAIGEIQSLKDAVGSAVDVMQAMLFSIHLYLRKVEEVNSLAIELAKVTAKERASLEQCTGFLSNYVTLKVKDCSLRTHMLQHKF